MLTHETNGRGETPTRRSRLAGLAAMAWIATLLAPGYDYAPTAAQHRAVCDLPASPLR